MHLFMRDTVSGFIRGSQEASATYFDKSNAQGINASLLDLQVGLKLGSIYIYIIYVIYCWWDNQEHVYHVYQ